jgi:hypothetical protein
MVGSAGVEQFERLPFGRSISGIAYIFKYGRNACPSVDAGIYHQAQFVNHPAGQHGTVDDAATLQRESPHLEYFSERLHSQRQVGALGAGEEI